MTSVWQNCQGDYKPQEFFLRDNCAVITRNLAEVEDGIYQWEEYAMLAEDYYKLEEYFNKAEAAEILLGEKEVSE